MHKVIDGRRYNTETARVVLDVDNNMHRHDFRYRSWTLYQTKRGTFFLHHYGGALTDMAIPCGSNGRGAGEELEPLEPQDAKQFLERHSDQPAAMAALEQLFGSSITDA